MKVVYFLAMASFLSVPPAYSAPLGNDVTIDFEGLRTETDDLPLVPSYTEEGYHFTTIDRKPDFGPDGLGFVGTQHPDFYGSTAIIPALFNDAIMTRVDGRPFGLKSLKLVEHFDRNSADPTLMRTLTLSGRRENGVTVSQTFAVDELPGFEPFAVSPAFTGLVQVSWNTDDAVTWWNHGVRVDDIVAFVVPEPACAASVVAIALVLPSLGRLRRR